MFGAPCLPESFWQKVVKQADGCWVWVGALDTNGYGIAWDKSVKRTKGAHRFAYERMVGAIPDGLVLDHETCDLPCCVNPAHLVPKTQAANILRGKGAAAQNARRSHCRSGHELTPENTRDHGRGCRECRTCEREQAQKRARER